MTNNFSRTIHDFIGSNFLYGQERELQDSASLMGEGIIDSTGVLQLVAFLEESYGITIEDNEIIPENLDSIENMTAYLVRKLAPNTKGKLGEQVGAIGGNA